MALIFGIHFITPPGKLPHIFQAVIALYSFVHFIAFSGYFHYLQLKEGREIVQGSQRQQVRSTKKKE